MSDRISKRSRKRTWIAWAIVILPTLAILSLPFWLGRWYWRSVKQELAAKGEKLFAEDFKRPAIPDSENYFAIPFFKEAIATQNRPPSVSSRLREKMSAFKSDRDFQKRTGAIPVADNKIAKPFPLEAYARGLPADATVEEKRAETLQWLTKFLEPWEPLRRELLAECGRPGSYAATNLSKGLEVDMGMNSAAVATQLCQFHAIAALAKGDTKSAFEDVRIMKRLAKAASGEPTIINSLVAVRCDAMADWTIRDGMNLWSDEQLRELATGQSPFDRKSITNSLRTERAAANATFEKMVDGGFPVPATGDPMPPLLSAFGHIPLANYNLTMQEVIDLTENPAVKPTDFDTFDRRFASMGKMDSLLHFFEKLSMPTFSGYVRSLLRQDNQTRLTRVVIALEQYRRKHGGTPAKLAALVPEFIDQIPEGAIPGQTIHYLPGTAGGYKIWTNGWNETDEGGIPGSASDDTKDWVLERDPEPNGS